MSAIPSLKINSAFDSNQEESAYVGPDCYSRMPQVVVSLMAEYLPLREIVILSRVNRHNAASLQMFPVRELDIPARLFEGLFSNIHKFPKLQKLETSFICTLDPYGITLLPDMAVTIQSPNASQTIRSVTINNSSSHVPILFLNALLARTPQLREFHFTHNNCYQQTYFTPQVGKNISEEAKANLAKLETLNVSYSTIHPTGLLELLQSSDSYMSLDLSHQSLDNGHLREITRNQNLTHLNLQFIKKVDAEGLDFQILRSLCALTHFAAAREMSEDDLIALIESNPNLEELDISHCDLLQTDRVLFKIAEKCPSLRSLKLSDASKINKPAFKALIDGCPALKELAIPKISVKIEADLSSEDRAAGVMTKEALIQALNTLKDRNQLEKLVLNDVKLTDDILDVIVSMPNLIMLSMSDYYSSKFTEVSLLKLQQLKNLEILDLGGIASVTEAVLTRIANHCPKLRDFYVNCCWNKIPENQRPTLQPIQTALKKGRLPNLKMLACQMSGIDQEAITAFGRTFPNISIR